MGVSFNKAKLRGIGLTGYLRYLRYILLPAILLLFLFSALLYFGHYLIQKPQVQKALLDRLTGSSGYSIKTGELEINVRHGLGVLVHNLEIDSKLDPDYMKAEKAGIILDMRQLILGRLEPTNIYLYQPNIQTAVSLNSFPAGQGRTHQGLFPLSFFSHSVPAVSIMDGVFHFADSGLYIKGVNLSIHQQKNNRMVRIVQGQGKIHFKNESAHLSLSGLLEQTAAHRNLDLVVTAQKIPLPWLSFPPEVEINTGYMNTRLTFKGSPGKDLSLAGKIEIASAEFSILSGERKWSSALPAILLEFESSCNQRAIETKYLNLTMGDTSLSAGLSLDFKEKRNPDISLNLKSNRIGFMVFKSLFPVPLFSSWIDNRLYPVLESGDIKINKFFIKGKYDQLRKIKCRENYSIIGLELACRNFILKGGSPALPFQNVWAGVALDDGTLSISNLQASFGQSRITKANLTIPDVFRSDPPFEARVLGRFRFRDLSTQSKMSLFPEGASSWISQLDPIEGTADCQADILYQGDWKTPRIVKGRFDLEDCTVSGEGRIRPIQITRAEIEIDPQAGNRFEGFGRWGSSALKAKGVFYVGDGNITLGETEFNGYADLEEILSAYYPAGNAVFAFSKTLSFHLTLMEQPGYYSCRGAIKLEAVAFHLGYLKAGSSRDQGDLNFDFDYWPGRRINLKRAVYRVEKSFIELTGYYSLARTGKYSGHIFTKGFSLQSLGIYSTSGERKLDGKVAGELKIEGLRNRPSATGLWGKFEGEDISWGVESSPVFLDKCNFLFRFEERDITIDKMNMRVGGRPIRVLGKGKGWSRWKAEIDVDLTFLDLDALLPELNRIPQKSFNIRQWDDIGLKLTLNCRAGVWRHINLGSLKVRLTGDGGNWDLQTLRVNLEHGIMEAGGRLAGGKPGGISLAGKIELKEQPLDEFIRGLNLFKESIKGPLSLKMDFRMKGRHLKDLIPSLNGHASMTMGNGLIKDARLFIKVLDLLNLQNIFKQRPPDLREEGFYFESMSGDATINNGVLKSENFVVRSPVFNAVGYGKIDLGKKSTDFYLGTQPHNTIDTLISNIPIVGYIITGENKAFLTYYFRVAGPMNDPDVRLIPFKSMEKGVTGIIKRLLLTPFRLFDQASHKL